MYMDMDFEDRIINLINDLIRLRQGLADAAYGDVGVTDAIIALRHQLKAVRMPGTVKSSRKAIKSGFAKINAQMIMKKLGQCDGIVKTCISICPDSRLEKELDRLQENIVDVAAKAEMLSNGDEHIQSSRKPIKSSLEDRLVPYLEEFEEGYSNALVEDPMDSYAGFDTTDARCETFYKTFKSDHNLTDDDINKLENAVVDMWHEADAEID